MSEENNYARQSSSSSLNSSCQDTEDDRTIANILSKETYRNGTLGKRLSHLDSIPHQPHVNGEIPDVNNAILDHERLSERLTTYGLADLQIEGDGNCQLKHFQKLYEGYVPMAYKSYLKKMKRCGEWGDHVTLQAAADRFRAKICLLTSFRDTCLIEIMPKDNTPLREIWLSFWSEVHYNSLYAADDVPTRVTKRKHWLF